MVSLSPDKYTLLSNVASPTALKVPFTSKTYDGDESLIPTLVPLTAIPRAGEPPVFPIQAIPLLVPK